MADKEYIERGALLENLKKQYGEELGWQCTVNMSDVGMMIEDAPAADVVEVRHGEWVIKTDDYDNEYMMCSCCKDEFYPVDADTVDSTPNYCPTCGAKMDGERKEQT